MYHSFCSQRNEQGYKQPYSLTQNSHYDARLPQSTTPHTSLALVPHNPHNTQGEHFNHDDDKFYLKVQETVQATKNVKL